MTRKRRGRGEGGIYQRTGGQWVGSLSMGYTAAGYSMESQRRMTLNA